MPEKQVAVIAPIAQPDALAAAAEQGVDVGEVDQALAVAAATQPFDTVRGVVQRYLAALDPHGPKPDPAEGRRLSMARHADGSVSGRFDLDPVGGEKEKDHPLPTPRPLGAGPWGWPFLARLQGPDASLRPVGGSRVLPLRTVKPQVIVTIPLEDLVDPATGAGAATTGSGATISAARARWVACDAGITRVVLDPDGVPLDYGRTKRLVPAGLRRAVELRDRHCVFAGCYVPTHWCDVHHVAEWLKDGGDTSLENSALPWFHPATPRGPRRACESRGGGGPSATAPTAPRSSSVRSCGSERQSRLVVASSSSPPKYWSRTWPKSGSSWAAEANSVIDERSFWASTGPNTATGSVAPSWVRAAAHSRNRGPSTGCAR